MGISRYNYVLKSNDDAGKEFQSISGASKIIFSAVESNSINCNVHVLESGERLDTLAGQHYKDSSYWWVIAAASGIGWGLQVPPGTVIRIPSNLSTVLGLLI
jgi:nucleoid-associated protein YgaU